MSEDEQSRQHRIRTGLLSLVSGALLIAWAWGSWIYRSSAAAPMLEDVEPVGQAAVEPSQTGALAMLIMVAMILLIIVLVITLIMSRGIRRRILSKPKSTPTDATDLWSMHQVPDEDEGSDPTSHDTN